MKKSEILSMRVEPTFQKELKAYCRSNGKTVSDVLRDGFCKDAGGTIGLFEAPEPDANLTDFLVSMGGGSAIGIMIYKGVYGVFKQKYPEMDDDKKEFYSVMAGIVTAMLSGVGISKFLKALK